MKHKSTLNCFPVQIFSANRSQAQCANTRGTLAATNSDPMKIQKPNMFTMRVFQLLLAGMLLLPGYCKAVATWVGGSTVSLSAYNTASNWSPSGVPASTETIQFNTAVTITSTLPMGTGNGLKITSTGSVTINSGDSLTVGDISISGSGGTFVNNGVLIGHNLSYVAGTAGATITNNGTMNLNNLNIGNGSTSGSFTNNSRLSVANNIVVEEGTFDNASGASVTTVGMTVQSNATVNNYGNIVSSSTSSNAQVSVNSGGTFNNKTGGHLTVDISIANVYSLDISGSFNNDAGAYIFIGHNPYNSNSQGIIVRSTGDLYNLGFTTIQIDPNNCVYTDNHGASGSFQVSPPTVISGKVNGTCAYTISLPIDLISFEVVESTLGKCKSEIKWTVGSNSSVTRFDILRSTDGTTFSSIASIQKGISDSYSITTDNVKGRQYYRLRMIADDEQTYSPVAGISSNCDAPSIQLSPNPTSDFLQVSGLQAGATVKILGLDGRVVYTGSTNESDLLKVDMRGLPLGVYLVMVAQGQSTWSANVIKH